MHRTFTLIFSAVVFSLQVAFALPFSDVIVSATDGKDGTPAKLMDSFDGSEKDVARFQWLNGAQVKMEFKKPVSIGALTLVQNEKKEWARPAILDLTVNGRYAQAVILKDAPGKIQQIRLNAVVSTLELRVSSIYPDRRNQKGTIGEIGYTADYVPPAAPSKKSSNAESVPSIKESEHRAFTIEPWGTAGYTVTVSNGKDAPAHKLSAIFNPKRWVTTLNPLEGSTIRVTYTPPRYVGFFVFQDGSMRDWSRLKEVACSINGGAEKNVLFDDKTGSQAVLINEDVHEIVFRVKSTYAGKKKMGGFKQMGVGEFAPVLYSTAKAPLPMKAEAVDFEIECDQELTVPLTAHISSQRLLYKGPMVTLKPGRHVYRVVLSEFKETGMYSLDWKACHICDIRFGVDPRAVTSNVKLLSAMPVLPPGASTDAWYELDKFDPPTRMINGEKWTEGMSYSSSGRFANSTYNGLLGEVVGDLWFQTYTASATAMHRRQKFDLYIAGNAVDETEIDPSKSWMIKGVSINGTDKIENSWTHMRRQMKLKAGAELTWITSILAPGFLGECNKPVTISSRGGGDIPKRSGAPDEDEQRFFLDSTRTQETPKIGPTMVITPDGRVLKSGSVQMEKLSEPWIIAVWGGLTRPIFWGDWATALLITMERGTVSWDKSGVNLPAGRFGISSSFHECFPHGWKMEKVCQRGSLLCSMLLNYPIQCREYYRVVGDNVHIYDEFEYEKWGNPRFRAKDYAPLPTIFTWGAMSNHWGALPVDTNRLLKTPAGPYAWNPGNTTTYTLPNPVNRHSAFPALPEYEKENKERAAKYIAQADPPPEALHRIADAWKTSFIPLRVGGSSLGMSFLGEEYRTRILTLLRTTVTNGFRDFAWVPRRELFSKRPYLTSLWVDAKVSPIMYGDVNSGIGTANYGLYIYSKYSGDWSLARRLWPRVMDTIRFCEVVNDWAIPMTSAREGVLFGGIDMDTIGFVGVTAAEQMAKQVGSKEDLERLSYLRAKLAPSVALRMTFQRYLDPKNDFPALWVNGFSESGANLEMANSKSGVGLDHNSMMYCWQGQQPEMFQFLMQIPGKETMTYLQKELMDKCFTGEDFSGWRKMPFNHTRTAAYLAMRAFLPDWNHDELVRDCNIWLKHSPAQNTAYNSGVFGAYQGSVDRVYLINWEPAALKHLAYDRPSRTLTATLSCDKAFLLEGSSPRKITSISIDGKKWTPAHIRYKADGIFSLEIPAVEKEVQISF